jgi:hypothetical protein
VVWVIVDGRRRRERLKVFTEFHGRLLERIGSAREFGEFLETDGGRNFLDSLSIEHGGPKLGIVRSVHTGVILTVLGLGLLIVSITLLYNEAEQGFRIAGVIVLSLGIGFLGAAVASYRVTGALDLLEERYGPARSVTR